MNINPGPLHHIERVREPGIEGYYVKALPPGICGELAN